MFKFKKGDKVRIVGGNDIFTVDQDNSNWLQKGYFELASEPSLIEKLERILDKIRVIGSVSKESHRERFYLTSGAGSYLTLTELIEKEYDRLFPEPKPECPLSKIECPVMTKVCGDILEQIIKGGGCVTCPLKKE